MTIKSIVFLICCLAIFKIDSFGQNQYTVQAPYDWVSDIQYSKTLESEQASGSFYLLVDRQENLEEETYFSHFAIKTLNPEGIQNMSDISVSFDPSYQQLIFHYVRVIRGNEVIDKLKNDRVNIIQRETSMERHLYDGSLTASMNLSDVRISDIIEYAYSIKGYNPTFKGKYYGRFSFSFTVPVGKLFTKLILPNNKPIDWKYFNGLKEPKLKKGARYSEYEWLFDDLEAVIYDNNVPSWYNPHPRVVYSTFKSWGELVSASLPNYTITKGDLRQLKMAVAKSLDLGISEANIIKAARFVQDEVRYLGFEQGLSAYKPHRPIDVFNRRYGDCKDKSLLLSKILHLI